MELTELKDRKTHQRTSRCAWGYVRLSSSVKLPKI